MQSQRAFRRNSEGSVTAAVYLGGTSNVIFPQRNNSGSGEHWLSVAHITGLAF